MSLDEINFKRALGLVVAAWIVLGALTLDPAGYSPFGPPKWLLISTLIPVAGFLGLRGQVSVHRRAIVLWAVFLGWVGLATLLGVDQFHGWVGTPDRRFGALAWLLCALAFVVGHRIVASNQAKTVYRALIVTGLGVGFYAFFEALDIAPVELVWFSSRLGSTYGSPAYLGAATALFLPTIAGATASVEGRWRLAGMASVALMLFAALASGTRAAWVGLAVALLIGGYQARRILAVRPKFLIGAVGLAALVVSFTPVGPRALDAVDLSEGTSAGRLAEWEVGLAAVTDRPFSGAGPEGYRVVFSEFVSADYAKTYGRSVIVDRAHNGMLDVATTVGIPGLILLLGLFAVVGRSVLAGLRSRDPLLIGTAAGLVAYVVQQQFLFPIAEIDPVAWLLAGMLVMRLSSESDRMSVGIPRPVPWVLGIVGAIALMVGGLDLGANRSAQDALASASGGDYQSAVELSDRATAMRPDSITYAQVGAEANRLEGSLASLDAALGHNSDGLGVSPQDPGLRAGRGALLLARSRLVQTQTAAQQAVDFWEQLAAEDPNNGRFQLQLGASYAQAQQWVEAEEAWLASVELSPEPFEAHLDLGWLYLGADEPIKAFEQAALAAEIDGDRPEIEVLLQAILRQS